MKSEPMVRHLFLTGEKQIGKSTLLKKALSGYCGSIAGFYTVRTKAFFKNEYSVHIYPVNGKRIPNEENLLFACGRLTDDIPQRFDRLGCSLLQQMGTCSLIVMDELGRHEAEAQLFRQAILSQLNGQIPILGVLQAPAEEYWPEITSHPNVKVMAVTAENRDDPELLKEMVALLPCQPMEIG